MRFVRIAPSASLIMGGGGGLAWSSYDTRALEGSHADIVLLSVSWVCSTVSQRLISARVMLVPFFVRVAVVSSLVLWCEAPLCSCRSVADELIADIFGSSDEEEEFAVSISLLLLLFPSSLCSSSSSSSMFCYCCTMLVGDKAGSFCARVLLADGCICRYFIAVKNDGCECGPLRTADQLNRTHWPVISVCVYLITPVSNELELEVNKTKPKLKSSKQNQQ